MQKNIALKILSLLLLIQLVAFIGVPNLTCKANTESVVIAEQISYVSKTVNDDAPFIKLETGVDNVIQCLKFRKKKISGFSLVKEKFKSHLTNYSHLCFITNPHLYGLPVRIVLHLFRI